MVYFHWRYTILFCMHRRGTNEEMESGCRYLAGSSDGDGAGLFVSAGSMGGAKQTGHNGDVVVGIF